ncbi:MAG: glycoside hydrolase [Acidimicrobiia bacterium]|nr:glycoside hydrolase [Acidimicrobiia bacterium]
MTDHSEHSERAEIEHRDPATTVILERVIVPDHAPDFWDELTLGMAQDEATTVMRSRRLQKQLTHRILLAAAVILILLVGSAVFAALPETGGNQAIDAGPTAVRDTGPEPDIAPDPEGESAPPPNSGTRASLERTTAELATVDSTSTASGSDAEWFFGDQLMWAGDEFVTGWGPADGGDAGYWISPDGVEWDHRDGPSPVLLDSFVCPSGYRCEVSPTLDPIPYHYAETQYEVMARAGDVLLLRASVFYTIDRQMPDIDGQETGPGPDLRPDLLAAAAAGDPCFAQLQAQSQGGVTDDSPDAPYLASWGSGGLDDPVIRLTCRRGETIAASFALDLRDHLTDEQVEKVYSSGFGAELWVERRGEAAARVTDAPSAGFWADGVPGDVVVQPVADIRSSGDRFWAASNGAVVTSTDGSTWTPVEVPTGGLVPTRIEAAAGGNLALRLSTDSNDWSNDRWITISHDDGSSWSAPVELPAEVGYLTAVGPAGAAVMTSGDGRDGFDGRDALSLIVDGGVAFTVDLPSTSCCESVAVGDDRVLLRTDQTLDVFQLDGTLIHRTMWADDTGGWNSRWLTLPLIMVVLMIGAVVIGFVSARARRTLSSE